MTDVPTTEPVENQPDPEPDEPKEEPTSEPTETVADKVRKAGAKEHDKKRSLDNLDEATRKLVEDEVSAALSKKNQSGEYRTKTQVAEDIAAARADWEASAKADRTFHHRLATEGILPGSPAYVKIEAAHRFFKESELITEEGVKALIAAAGLNAEAAHDVGPEGTPIMANNMPEPGPVGGKTDSDVRKYGAATNISDVEARLKKLETEE